MNSPTTAAGWLVAHGIRATVFGLIVLTFDMHATAQSASPAQSALPVVFVGAGWGPATDDALSRMAIDKFAEDSRIWIIEGGVAVCRGASALVLSTRNPG